MNIDISTYIEKLIEDCLNAAIFSSLTPQQKEEMVADLRDYFYFAVLETVLNNLTEGQIQQLKSLPPESPELEKMMEEYVSQMPSLAEDIEYRLNKDFEIISQTAILPNNLYHKM